MKKVFGSRLQSLLMLSVLLLVLVQASLVIAQKDVGVPAPAEIVGTSSNIFDPIRSLFSDWSEGNVSPNVAKFFFFFLLTLLLYSIFDTTGLVNSPGIRWTLSAVVAFLSTAFMAQSQVWLLIISYDALGMTILSLFPVAVLCFYTFRVASSGGPGGIVIQYVSWIVYLVFLIGFFVAGMFNGAVSYSDPFAWIYIVAVVFSILMVIANKQIIEFIINKYIEAQGEAAGRTADQVVNAADAMKTIAEGLGHGRG